MSAINRKERIFKWIIAVLVLVLAITCSKIYLFTQQTSNRVSISGYDANLSFMQKPDYILSMYAGILEKNANFEKGEDLVITYDFSHPDYITLREKYNVENIAGEGTEFQRAERLMNEFAPRLTHSSNYNGVVEYKALPLLEYSLDNVDKGINCRAKARVLNEMCSALGIYSRVVTIASYSKYDSDCHVVNEIYDTGLKKWIMLDITTNQYWIDEQGRPLSVLELRRYLAAQRITAPVNYGDVIGKLDSVKLSEIKKVNQERYMYMAKNLCFISCSSLQSVGEAGESYYLSIGVERWGKKISENAFAKSPILTYPQS